MKSVLVDIVVGTYNHNKHIALQDTPSRVTFFLNSGNERMMTPTDKILDERSVVIILLYFNFTFT